MVVYRISKRDYCEDLRGEGARLYGGRWNPKGTAVVYTAESRALAMVECLVHTPLSLLPRQMYLAEIRLPEGALWEEVDKASLPDRWRESPPLRELAQRGKEWLDRNERLLLRVPSAVVPGEWNLLVNPRHSLFPGVVIESVAPLAFDERLR